jgi:hypothetical protein
MLATKTIAYDCFYNTKQRPIDKGDSVYKDFMKWCNSEVNGMMARKITELNLSFLTKTVSTSKGKYMLKMNLPTIEVIGY